MKTIRLIPILSLLALVLQAGSVIAQQTGDTPIPSGTKVIVWMRVSQAARDPQLSAMLLTNSAVARNLELIGLEASQVDRATIFMPFDRSWLDSRQVARLPQALPPNAGFIISGNFSDKDIYPILKSKNWKEMKYANSKVLWWSTGASYYRDPGGSVCIGIIPGSRFVVTGSEKTMQDILDIAGGKSQGMASNSTYEYMRNEFDGNDSRLASIFIAVTPEMRTLIKADTVRVRSATARAALSYVDYVDEAGFSALKGAASYTLNGYLGMDTETNALVVSSIFQFGGGFAALLPPNDPNSSILENLDVSKQGRIVVLQSDISPQQLQNLLR